jgi:hypothetical protein
VILAFIGAKLILHWAHEEFSKSVPEISTALSLIVIAGVLAVTTVASLVKVRMDPSAQAHAGVVTGSHAPPADRSVTSRAADERVGQEHDPAEEDGSGESVGRAAPERPPGERG